MITAQQIRAARGLLDWKQSDLADKTGLSIPSIRSIERMVGSSRLSTLQTIKDVFQSAGVEFIGANGVQKHSEVFEMIEFQGDDFIEKLNDDLFLCMRGPEDEVLMYGIDDSLFAKYTPDEIPRWEEHLRKTNFRQRALVKEGDTYFLTDTEIYRWTLPQMVGLVPYYVYNDRLIMIMWETKRVMIIRSQAIANTFRAQFESLWEMSKPIPPNSKNKMDDPGYRASVTEKINKKKKAGA